MTWRRRAVFALVILVPFVWMGILTSVTVGEPRRIRSQTERFVSGTCDAWSDIALIYGPQRKGQVVPYPRTVGPTLFKIQADFRKAYITHGCNDSSGMLPPPDLRVIPYLPKDLRPR